MADKCSRMRDAVLFLCLRRMWMFAMITAEWILAVLCTQAMNAVVFAEFHCNQRRLYLIQAYLSDSVFRPPKKHVRIPDTLRNFITVQPNGLRSGNVKDSQSGNALFEPQQGSRLPWLRFSVVLVSLSRQILRYYLDLDHDRSLPNPFRFVYRPIIWRYAIELQTVP